MAERTTIKDVAREANVSTTTISRFYNHPEALDKSTYERIEEAIRKTDFIPSMAARSLKSRNSQMFLLYVPDICNPFYSKMAKVMQRLADENDYIMAICDTGEDAERELSAISMAHQIYASGIFAASVNAAEQVMEQLANFSAPVVGMNSYPAGSPFDVVGVHHLGGTNLAAKHLISMGHRELVFAGGKPGTVIAESRRHGYLYAMEKAGLPVSDEMIYEEGFSQEAGYRAGMHFARASKMPTAICCANDLIAFGVIHALDDLGIRVPEAVSVTGMDDIPYASMASPRLTTVTNDGELFAREAFQMMRERIDHSYDGPGRFTEIPNELIVRGSTAMPRTMRPF